MEGACSLSSSENPQFDPQPPLAPEPPAHDTGRLDDPITPDTIPHSADSGANGGVPATYPPVATPRDPVWTGWDVLLIAALTLVLIPVVGVIAVLAARVIWPHLSVTAVAPEIVIVAQFLAYIGVAICMVMLVEGKYHVPFWRAIHWNWPRSGWKMFTLGVMLLLTITLIARFLPMPKTTPFDQFFASPRDAYLISIFAVTFGPFMEELFFRGLLYPVLARRMGVFWGVLLTAAPFAMMHMFQYGYAWGVVLLIFVMGIVVTIVRAATGSVAASFLVHVGYNATEMFLMMIATDGFRHMEKAVLAVS